MLLEKLKQHGGKIMFFVMNILIVATSVVLLRQKNIQQADKLSAQADAQSYKSAADYALDAQQRIMTDKVAKINSIANNPDTVQREVGVTVSKTIPAVTKTVTVSQPITTSSSTTTAKTTTKKS
jgi:hypothetical protein